MPQPHFQHSTPPLWSLSSLVTMNFWIDKCVNIWVLILVTLAAFAVGGLLMYWLRRFCSHAPPPQAPAPPLVATAQGNLQVIGSPPLSNEEDDPPNL